MRSRYRGAIVLCMDLCLIFSCNCLVFLPAMLRQDVRAWNLFLHIALLAVCMLVFQIPLRTYNSLWRYAESREYLALLAGMGLGYLLYTAVDLLAGMSLIWVRGALTGTALALLLMLAIRFCYRIYRYRVSTTRAEGRSYVAILGAGAAGTRTGGTSRTVCSTTRRTSATRRWTGCRSGDRSTACRNIYRTRR